MPRILLTGAAGFIGYHTAMRLLERGDAVVGVDNLNPYYDVGLKEARLSRLREKPNFDFRRLDLADRPGAADLFRQVRPDLVIHLAAQAGVRFSLENPFAYLDSNVAGFLTALEGCRAQKTPKLVYASSSSVYGATRATPFRITHNVDHPVSLYAATKKANELMAHTYSHLYGVPTTGLRLFTVYGPWGRPDMSYFLFTKAILEGRPIDVFNNGELSRDFTYVADAVEAIVRIADATIEGPYDSPVGAPYRLYNVGNHEPVSVLVMIAQLEKVIGIPAKRHMMPMQPGDVPVTFADCEPLMRDTGFQPATRLETGLRHFVEWYRDFYGT